jgi:uncharacterized spore protein YtfJ
MKAVNESYEKNANVKIVFGEATEKEGVTVIPVAKVCAKVGEGNTFNISIGSPINNAKVPKDEALEMAEKKIEKAGYGIDAKLTPIGFIEIKDGKAEFKPIIDVTRIATMGICYAAFFVFMVTRMITKIARIQGKKCKCDCKDKEANANSDSTTEGKNKCCSGVKK